MKAARFHGGGGTLVVEDVPARSPGPGEVMVAVRYCGVCGTDTHIVHGDKGSMEVTPPRILGHEFSGMVAEIGADVTHVRVGDRVSADVNYSCGHCDACGRGAHHLCDAMVGVGTALDGAFAEFVTVPAEAVFTLPDPVSLEAGAFAEPLSCCLHGVDRLDIRLGDKVVVIGAGTIGLIMLQLCLRAGAASVAVVEPIERQRVLAEEFGASLVVDPACGNVVDVLVAAGFGPADKAVDCAGTVATAELALEIAARGATVMLFGLTGPDDRVSVRPFELFQKELTVTASFVNPNAFERAIRLLAAGIVRVEPLISGVVPLERINEVFSTRLRGGKTLIEVARHSAASDQKEDD